MKLRLLPALCVSLCLSVSGLAQFAGTSDFSNSTNWQATPTESGSGDMTFTGSVLQYAAASPTSSDSAYTVWTLGNASYTSNWSISIDVHLASFSLSGTQSVNLNLSAVNSLEIPVMGTNGDQITLALDRYFDGSTHSGFETTMNAFYSATNTNPPASYVSNATLDAALAISFDSTTKIISTYYDANGPIGGHTWTLMNSYDIGSGTYNWGMGPTDTFTFVLIGASEGVTINPTEAYFDNFAAVATAVPEPSTYAAILGACALGLVVLRRRVGARN